MLSQVQKLPAAAAATATATSPSAAAKQGGISPFVYKKGTAVPPAIAAQAKHVAQGRSKTTTTIPTGHAEAEADALLPLVKLSDLQLGKLLGHGSYSSAYEIQNDDDNKDNSKKRQILKQLSPKVKENPLLFAACAADLIQEAQILHYIGKSHANICDIYAWSGPNMMADYLQGDSDNCLLVLEELVETLEDKLKAWQLASNSLWYTIYEETNQPEYFKLLKEKCRHILGMAQALEYLHQHRVLHRDLKPANIGFNQQGVLKVFDFDLSRVLPSGSKEDDDLFQMTHSVGSPRYMAPEIKLKQKYNCSADVYSFGILVYQMLTLEVPFIRSTSTSGTSNGSTARDWSTHNKYVPNDWSLEVRECMGNCLQDADHFAKRPTMAKLVEELNKCHTIHQGKEETIDKKSLLSDSTATEIEETTTDDVADDTCCDHSNKPCGPEPEKKGWFW